MALKENTTMTHSNITERLDNANQVLGAYLTMQARRRNAWMAAPDSQVEVRYAEYRQAELQVNAAYATRDQLRARWMAGAK